jgi:RimJ/RimL family protein N-acetyltransferase
MDDLILLRPVAEADLPVLDRLYEDPVDASQYGFFGWSDPGRMRRRFTQGLISQDKGTLAVARISDGACVGDVGWHRVETAPDSATWNIGISLLADERGKGYGWRAQRLLAEYLFKYTRHYRIEATTELSNLAEQRALEKAGFTREGVLRGACFRAGAWRDMVSYSILRGDVVFED